MKQQAPLRGGHEQDLLAVIQLHDGRRLFQHQVGVTDTLRERGRRNPAQAEGEQPRCLEDREMYLGQFTP